jgi:hypothetical protein
MPEHSVNDDRHTGDEHQPKRHWLTIGTVPNERRNVCDFLASIDVFQADRLEARGAQFANRVVTNGFTSPDFLSGSGAARRRNKELFSGAT